MSKPNKPLIDYVSKALRDKSLVQLQGVFARYVEILSSRSTDDARDVMVGLAAYIDCARRLGYDPETVLGPSAASGATWFRELFGLFVRRSDITLDAFGWSLTETPEGIAYKPAAPKPTM